MALKIYIKKQRQLPPGINYKTGNQYLGTKVRELTREEGEKVCEHTKKVLEIVEQISTTDAFNHEDKSRVSSKAQLTTLYKLGRVCKRNPNYKPQHYTPKDPKWYTGEEICLDIQKRIDDFLDDQRNNWLPVHMFDKLERYMNKVIATVEKRNRPYGKEASKEYRDAWERCRIQWIQGIRPKNTFNEITIGDE